jgi:hypothetical protein
MRDIAGHLIGRDYRPTYHVELHAELGQIPMLTSVVRTADMNASTWATCAEVEKP